MNDIYFITLVFIVLPFRNFCAEAAASPLDSILRNRALIQAVERCDKTEARRLMAQGACIDQLVLTDTQISFGGIRPSNGKPYMMRLPLLDHLLVRFEHEPEKCEASVQLLLQLGGRADYENCFGRTPLFYASTAALTKLYIAAGCAPKYCDQCGRRALHEAMRHGRVDVVQALLAHGALLTVVDNVPRTPLDLILNSTRRRKHTLCKALVLEGPQEMWFSEIPCMRGLPEDIQFRIIDFIPLEPPLLSPPGNEPFKNDFADSYIQGIIDQTD